MLTGHDRCAGALRRWLAQSVQVYGQGGCGHQYPDPHCLICLSRHALGDADYSHLDDAAIDIVRQRMDERLDQ